ncbi:MAG: DUF4062 domain-containing protein [Deltaproteobacteria bacterium]|nr:DUF4062 domain-containing protein [Deltaproteobacteria bacterium]
MIEDDNAQPRRRPVIRVFVSSTFTDLKRERDALQRDVFPRPFDCAQGRSAGAVCTAWLPLSGHRPALGRSRGSGARSCARLLSITVGQ